MLWRACASEMDTTRGRCLVHRALDARWAARSFFRSVLSLWPCVLSSVCVRSEPEGRPLKCGIQSSNPERDAAGRLSALAHPPRSQSPLGSGVDASAARYSCTTLHTSLRLRLCRALERRPPTLLRPGRRRAVVRRIEGRSLPLGLRRLDRRVGCRCRVRRRRRALALDRSAPPRTPPPPRRARSTRSRRRAS